MKKPKILFLDVENSPNKSLTWPGRMYDVNLAGFVPGGRWQLLSFSWAWNDGPIKYDSKQNDKDDKRIVKHMADLIDEADFLVTHNGIKSDIPKIRTRLKKHYPKVNLKPVKHVDTLRIIKPYYLLDSYSLGNVCEYFGLGKKIDAGGIETWIGCDEGDKKSWAKMKKYNPHDIVLLRNLYHFAEKDMPNHPSIKLLTNPYDRDFSKCPRCLSSDSLRRGIRANSSSAQQQWKCRKCDRWFLTRMPPKETK